MGGVLKEEVSQFNRVFNVVIYMIFVGFLISSVFYLRYSEIFAGLLLLLGFFGLKGVRQASKKEPLEPYEKHLLLVLALYGAVSIISFISWPATSESHMRVEDDIKFLLFIPLYFLFRQYNFNAKQLLTVFTVFAVLMGLVSLCQLYNLAPISDLYGNNRRPSAGVNPMRYAAIALIISCFLINFLLAIKKKSVAIKFAIFFASSCGLIACILTETRGVWLAIPLLVFLYGYFTFKRGNRKYLVITTLSTVLIVSVAAQLSFVQDRITYTFNSIDRYLDGNGRSSIGARLDMYNASLIIAKDSPVFGHGLGVFKQKSKEIKELGLLGSRVSREVGNRKTPHNEFFQALVERGLIGVLVTVLLFAVPAYIFYQAVRSRSEGVVYYGLCGLSVLIVFFVAGQTGTLFNHNLFTNFYIIMILLFVSQIRVLGGNLNKPDPLLAA